MLLMIQPATPLKSVDVTTDAHVLLPGRTEICGLPPDTPVSSVTDTATSCMLIQPVVSMVP